MNRSISAVVAAMVLAVTGCGGQADGSSTGASSSDSVDEGKRLDQAARDCLLGSASDEGMSLSLDTQGDDEYDADGPYDTVEDISCVLYELDTPDFVLQHMDSTRALDGQQTDEWDGLEARWTYHPDSGIEMTVIDRS